MGEFFNMGGHGVYVWSAYGIALIVLVGNALLPRRDERAALARLATRFDGDER